MPPFFILWQEELFNVSQTNIKENYHANEDHLLR